MGAKNFLFGSDTMWLLVLAGLAACVLSRVNGAVSLGNVPPFSREPPVESSGEDADPEGSFPVEVLFGQQPRVAGEDPSEFLEDVSGFVGNSGFVGTV